MPPLDNNILGCQRCFAKPVASMTQHLEHVTVEAGAGANRTERSNQGNDATMRKLVGRPLTDRQTDIGQVAMLGNWHAMIAKPGTSSNMSEPSYKYPVEIEEHLSKHCRYVRHRNSR